MPAVLPGLVAPPLPHGTGPWTSKAAQGDPAALGSWAGSGWGALGRPGSFSASALERGMELLERTWCQDHSGVVVMPGTTLIPTAAALSWGSPHPLGWIQPQDVFLSLCPASWQECAGSISLLCWPCLASLPPPWHPCHPGHAGDATGMGTGLCTLRGFGD